MTITILDGGMGRELERIGAPFQQPEWSAKALLEDAQWVTQAHNNFIEAGSEVITTNSYACVPFHIGEELYAQRGAELIELAAKIAREAADCASHHVAVAGCIPPVLGSYRPDRFNREQAYSLIQDQIDYQQNYVDFWLCETVSSLAEVELLTELLNKQDLKRAVWVSFSLNDSLDSEVTLRSGESIEEAVKKAAQAGVEAILFNCSIPEVMSPALKIAKASLEKSGYDIPLGVYPNKFSEVKSGHYANNTLLQMREMSVDEFFAFSQQWQKDGASIIGGCCGISPEYIKTLTALKR